MEHMATLWLTPAEHLPFRNKKKARTPVTDVRASFFPPEPLAGEICGAAPIPEASPQAFVVTHLTFAIRRSGGSCR